MLFSKLLPQDGNFFKLFNQHADCVVNAARALAQLVAAQAEIAVHTTGLAGGPAAVAQANLGAVTGQALDLAVDLQALHRVGSGIEGSHQSVALGGEALNHLLALHVARNHRLLRHAAWIS